MFPPSFGDLDPNLNLDRVGFDLRSTFVEKTVYGADALPLSVARCSLKQFFNRLVFSVTGRDGDKLLFEFEFTGTKVECETR